MWGLFLTVLPADLTPDAPLLLEGASVYVSAEAPPQKASVLIRDGRIEFVGDPSQARLLAPQASVLDLKGGFLFPGWADAHGHLLGLGKALETADLRGAPSAAEAVRRMAEIAGKLPPGSWAEGRGWDQNRWSGEAFPDAHDLDAVLAGRPAVARRVDGHAVWVNSAALAAAGIGAGTRDPEGGRIVRRPDGSPSGVLIDNAMALIEKAMPPPSPADFERRVLAAARACARVGLTEVQDASSYAPAEISTLERLAREELLPIRVYATVSPGESYEQRLAEPPPSAQEGSLARLFARGPRVRKGRDFLTVRAIKAYADGALGSRGAALLRDYSDDPGNRGLLVTSPSRLQEIAREARQNGWQVWIHAIGDRGNRLALDAYAAAEKSVPVAAPGGDRPRIEHAQVVAPEDIARFASLGVIASIQPTHATSDMAWAELRLGPERVRGAYAWRQIRSAGARMAGGSDFPVESENPLFGFYAAVTRQDREGQPSGGWRPQERLTRREALALFTSDAAYAAFEEGRRGRIAPGYEADVTVFGGDPMAVPERDIPPIRVALTLVGGRVAYRPGPSGEATR